MLAITRKIEEEFWIGPGIRIKVLEIRGNRVRLGIEAPRDVRISRDVPCSESHADDPYQLELPLLPLPESAATLKPAE